MPVALSLTMRQLIVAETQKGKPLRHIAAEYKLSYTTVCRLMQRYKTEGPPGLLPHFHHCGGHSLYAPWVKRAAVWLKRLHPGWGATFIQVLLEERYGKVVPGERTLQRWFVNAGLRVLKNTWSNEPRSKARQVHAIWQVDAKEKLRLPDGSPFCYLTVVDQKSGSLLNGFVFPPLSLQ